MRNAEEREKLLEQITELERNSINYFDVEKEFFLITSDNLHTVRPKLYGYSIQRDGIYEDDNLTEAAVAGLDGRGCYVYVDVRDGQITIKQDINGCWGIYLFRQGDYFALSNSFFRLLDHVKFHYPLTVNRDYCHQYLVNEICSHSFLTAVNEIQLIERNAICHIDVAKKILEIELIDYKEHSVPLASEEGVAVLDRWIELWSDVLRGVTQHTNFFSTALSGGFDTRILFLLLLNSGVDLSKVSINSSTSSNPTHIEDYKIASKIVEHYDLKLNQPLPYSQALQYSMFDNWNIEIYSRMTFHKIFHFNATKKSLDKAYTLSGGGGELIRGNWLRFDTWEEYINRHQLSYLKNYSNRLSSKLATSMKNTLQYASDVICNKYNIEDKNSAYIQQYLYQEVRARNHCGKVALIDYFKGSILICPTFYDPELRTLQFNTEKYSDANLLTALLYVRYEPDLLKFPFQGGRSIVPETIAYAQEINRRFPLRPKNENNMNGGGQFHLQPRDLQVEKILSSGHNNPTIPSKLFESCSKAMFESSRTYGLFTTYFDSELYHYAADFYENNFFRRGHHLYSILGVTRVLEDVEISQRNYHQYQDMKRFLEQDFATIHDNEEKKILSELLSKFNPYLTARVDVRFFPKDEQGDFQILSCSDGRAKIKKPEWLNKDDVSYMITSYIGNLELVAKSTMDGQIQIYLWTLPYRDPEDKSKEVIYWIDYTKLIVNEETVFDTVTPAWHGKAYNYNLNVKANEEVKIQVEWLPHRSDT